MTSNIPIMNYSFGNTEIGAGVPDSALEALKEFLQRDGMNEPEKISLHGFARFAEVDQYSLVLQFDMYHEVPKFVFDKLSKHKEVYNYTVMLGYDDAYENATLKLLVYVRFEIEKYAQVPQDAKEQIAIIREWLKSFDRRFSVQNGRGTAWGWVEIWGNTKGGDFSEHQKSVLRRVGLGFGANCAVISPDERAFWCNKALSWRT